MAGRRIGIRIVVSTALVLGCVAVAQFGSAGAQAAVLPPVVPVADAYVQSDQPSVNFGTALTLNNVIGTPEARAYLKFDVSGVSGTITKATFRVFTQTSSGSGYELHSVADNTWTEGGITYANRPAVGATVGVATNISSNTWTTVDVTSVVTAPGVYSFEMNAVSANLKKYSSRESGANAPQLVIETAAVGNPPAAIATVAGTTPQSATVNAPFATSLAAKVTDSGGQPVAGATVTFTAPGSGASGTFSGGSASATATSGVDGVATAPTFAANTTTGSYTVSATVVGVTGGATFSLTNTAATGPTTVPVSEDSYVQADQATTNFGTATVLKNVTSPDSRAYLKFTVGGLGGAVTKATFRVFTQTSSGSGYELHSVADSTWTQAGLTYNNRPTVGGVLGTAVNITSNTWTTVDVTSYVTGNGTYSFEMNATSSSLKQYSSKEGANPAQLVLEVAAPPNPATKLTVSAGNNQSATVGTSFANSLAVLATDVNDAPAPNTSVTFTAPGSGAGGTFAGGSATVTVVTAANGTANAPIFTANNTAGAYQVSASAPGVPTVTFSLTNTAVSTPTATITADAYVRSDQPDTNFGTSALLVARATPEYYSFLKFSLTNVNQPPFTATLRVWMQTTGATAMKVYQVPDTSWTETGVTFTTRPALGGLAFTSGATTSGTWLDLDVTGLVNGNGPVTFGLTTGSTAAKNFSSREDTAHAPQLVLQMPPPANGDPVIGAVGDIACDPVDPNWNNNLGQNGFCHHKATSDVALALNPQWMLTIGDTVYNGGTATQFSASYDPTWGRLKAITRPVLGNHEFGTSGASGYFNYFGAAATPLAPGCRSNCDGWYSYNVGAWHIVALNTECDRNAGACAAGGAQETWLRSDLQANAGACTLVYTHHPKWSSSSFADANHDALIQAMYDNNVDLMLVGHAHEYERFAPQDPTSQLDNARGITEIQVGTGGRDFSGFSAVLPNSLVRNNNTYGILKLTLHPTSADFQFLRDPTSAGFLADAGTVTCH